MTNINETELKRLYNQFPRLTYNEISQELGLNFGVINQAIVKLIKRGELVGRKGVGIYDLTQSQIDKLTKIAAMRRQCMTWRQIGKEFGTTHQAVHNFVLHYMPDLSRQLESEWIEQVIILYTTGLTTVEIAKKLNKSRPFVSSQIAWLIDENRLKPRKRISNFSQTKIKKLRLIDQARKNNTRWIDIAQSFGIKNYTYLIRFYTKNKFRLVIDIK